MGAFFKNIILYSFRNTHFKCIFTIQGVPKNGKCNVIGIKLRCMTFINIATLLKRFVFIRWSLLSAFCPKYINILIQSVFLHYGVFQKNGKMQWNGLKIGINDVYSYFWAPWKFCLHEVEPFDCLLSKIYRYAIWSVLSPDRVSK